MKALEFAKHIEDKAKEFVDLVNFHKFEQSDLDIIEEYNETDLHISIDDVVVRIVDLGLECYASSTTNNGTTFDVYGIARGINEEEGFGSFGDFNSTIMLNFVD